MSELNDQITQFFGTLPDPLPEHPGFPVQGKLHTCTHCRRRILVEDIINGVSHTVGQAAVCWDCLSEDTKQKCREAYGITDA